MIGYYSASLTMTSPSATSSKPYMAVAYDIAGDKMSSFGGLDLTTARFSGSSEARRVIQDAVDNAKGMLFPPRRIEVFKLEKVATADINDETEVKTVSKLGRWNMV